MLNCWENYKPQVGDTVCYASTSAIGMLALAEIKAVNEDTYTLCPINDGFEMFMSLDDIIHATALVDMYASNKCCCGSDKIYGKGPHTDYCPKSRRIR